jgi:hypothetical protein
MSNQNQISIGEGVTLQRTEHLILMREAWAAACLGAPEAVLMISRRGIRFFAADSFASPAWWVDVRIRDPAATRGRALIARPAELAAALWATWWRARGGSRIIPGPGAVHFEAHGRVAEVRCRVVDFGPGAGIIISDDEEFEVGDYYPIAVAEAPSTIAADIAAVAARYAGVELLLTREADGWLLEVTGDNWVRRAPVRMSMIPPHHCVVGWYRAMVLAELLSMAGPGDLTVELTEPWERPALHAHWDVARRIHVEAFVAPLE